MIEKPEQYYDTWCHQFYYQWNESEHLTHREPIFDRTRNYIESLDAENAKLREYVESYAKAVECEGCGWCPYDIKAVCNPEMVPMRDGCKLYEELRELGIKVD